MLIDITIRYTQRERERERERKKGIERKKRQTDREKATFGVADKPNKSLIGPIKRLG